MASEHWCARPGCGHRLKAHITGGCQSDGFHRLTGGCTCPGFTERACCDGLFGTPHAADCCDHGPLAAPMEAISSWGEGVIYVWFGDGPRMPLDATTPIYEATREALSRDTVRP